MISKRTILLLMAIWVFSTIYYQEYKKEQKLCATPTLNSVMLSSIHGIDPVKVSDKCAIEVASKIYEGLYAYHYLKRPFQLVPNLAEEMPSISPDGLVYTFKIKQGVVFQDDPCFPNGKGRALKAADFVFSLKRLVDPKNVAPYFGLIAGKIKGLDGKQQLDDTQEIEGLKALDDHTLQVTLTEPWAAFVHFLAMPAAFVVAKEAVMHYGPEFLNHPVGTGPFILEGGFNPQAKQLTFVKNPSFREKLFPTEGDAQYQPMLAAYAGRRLPLVDKVVTDIITEDQLRLSKLESRGIDMQEVSNVGFSSSFIGSKGELLPKWGKKGLVLIQSPSAKTQFFAFNHSHEVFKNTYLRQAMSMAFDREAYNQTCYKGTAQVAQSLVPPMLMEDSPLLTAPYGYNLECAKECLVKAGFPGGQGLPVIMLDILAETDYKDQAAFFAKCMANIGIAVQVVTNAPAEFWHKISTGATMMHLFTWQADYPEPSSFFQLISDKPLAGLFYENPKFNALLHKAMATTHHAERQAHYLALHKIATEEVPMIYALHIPTRYLHYNWVKNVVCNDFCPSLDTYIAVDMKTKVKATK